MCTVILTDLGLKVNSILAWGRAKPTSHTVAALGEFTKSETEALRKLLRAEYQGRNPAVVGEWRTGYEMAIGNERVGVTNGHGPSFLIYYSRRELTGYGRATANAADLLAEIEAEVEAKYAARNRGYDLVLKPDPLNCEPQRGGWMVRE